MNEEDEDEDCDAGEPESSQGRGDGPFACIVVAEGDFGGRHNFPTQEALEAFARGVEAGVCLYGGGDCEVLTRADLERGGCADLDAATRALVERHLPV